jgi:hypothetical protein
VAGLPFYCDIITSLLSIATFAFIVKVKLCFYGVYWVGSLMLAAEGHRKVLLGLCFQQYIRIRNVVIKYLKHHEL